MTEVQAVMAILRLARVAIWLDNIQWICKQLAARLFHYYSSAIANHQLGSEFEFRSDADERALQCFAQSASLASVQGTKKCT